MDFRRCCRLTNLGHRVASTLAVLPGIFMLSTAWTGMVFGQTIDLGYDEAVANATVQQGGARSGSSGTNFFNIQNNANGNFASYGVTEWNLGAGSFLNAPAGLVGDDIGGLSVRMTQSNASFSSDTPLRFWLWNNTTASIAPGSTDITFDPAAVGGISDPPQPWFSDPYSIWELGTGNYTVTASGDQDTFTFDATLWDAAARDYVATQLNDSGLLRVVIESTLDTGANGTATYAGYTNATYTGPELQLTVGGSIPTDTPAWWTADGVALGGSGSWTAAGANWSPTESPVAAAAWDSTTVATFAGTGGTVTVAEPLAVSGGISFTADGYTLSGGGLTLSDAPGFAFTTINVAEAATATIDTPLAGTVTALRKTGTGTLSLGGTNTFTGPVRLQEGTLAVSSDAAFGDLTNAVEFDGGTLSVPTSLDLGSRTLGGVGTGAGAGTIDIAAGATLSTAGSVNLGNLTLPGGGTLAVNGFSNVIGTVSATLTSGTARIEGAIDLGDSGRTWTVAAGGTLEIPGSLTSVGTLRKEGEGTLVLAGDNSSLERFGIGNQGSTPVDGGTVQVGNANALGFQDVYFNNGTIEATTPLEFANGLSIGGRANGASRLVGEAMTFSGLIGTFNPNGAIGDVTLIVDNETTFSGIVEATGTPLTVGGTGTLKMAALTTGLTVPVTLADSVTLQLENFSSMTPPLLTVGGSATLAGAGTVGSLTVDAGGTLSPGTSPGSILAGDTTLASGGNYNFEIANAAGTAGFDWDLLDVTGTLTVASTPEEPFAVNLWSLASTNPDSSGDVPGFDNQTGYAWTFARATSGIVDFAGDKFSVNTAAINGTDGFTNDLAGGSFSVAASGNDLNVVFTPFVPTPSLDWYGNGVSEGGSGTWSSLGSTWSPDGGSTIGTWDPQRKAVFGGTAGTVTIDAGGISAAVGLEFAADGYAVTGGTLTLAGATTADNAIEVGSGRTATIAAPIAGTAGLTKAGTGTLLLSGANTYSGGTAIAAGTLQVGDGSSGSIAGDVSIQTGGRLVLNPAGSSSFAGSISGGGEVVKQGSGDLTLSGFSSHTGGTRLEGGSITASGFSALGSGDVTAVDGQLYVEANSSISSPITVGEGASGTPVLLAGWDFQTTTNGGTAVAAQPNTPTTLIANFGSGTISLDGSNGSSAWDQATQLNAFAGTTENVGPDFSTVTSGAASLVLVGDTANGQDAVFAVDMTGYGLLDVSYATRGTSTGFASQNWSISTDGVTWQPVGSETDFSSTWTVRELATISGLAEASTAYLRLSVDGATTSGGNNRLDNVQLVATPGGAVGTVVLGTQATSGTASFSSPIVLNQNVTLAAPTGGRADFTGVISDGVGQNGITKTGGGVVTLSGPNTYAGATTVQEGTLLVNALNGPSAITVASGATLGGTGTTGPLALAAGSTLAPGTQGPGTLSAGATTLAGGGSYAFQISDASGLPGSGWDFLDIEGGLTVEATQASPYTVDLWTVSFGDTSGPAFGFDPLQPYRWTFLDTTESLDGLDLTAFAVNASATSTTGGFANDTQGGTFSVGLSAAGTGLDIVFTPDAATSSLVWYGDDASPGGKGDWTDLNVNWFNGTALQTWDSGKTAAFDTVGGEVTIGPAGITAGNGVSFAAADYLVSGGSLTLSGSSKVVNAVSVEAGLSATIAAPLAGFAGMTKSGSGTLVLSGESTLTGGTTVAAGTLQIGAGGTSGSLGGDIDVGTAGTLAVNRSDEVTISGVVSGGGNLAKQGTGTLVLTGANTYTGGTNVAEGTVVVGDGAVSGGIAEAGDLSLAATTVLAFDRSDDIAFTGGVTGSGTLAQRGSGTLTLSRPTAYGDAFTLEVSSGTVNLDRSGATLVGILGAGNTVDLAGGTLQLTSNSGRETLFEDALINVESSSTLAINRIGGPNNHNTPGFSAPITVANDSTLSFDYRGDIPEGFSASTTYTAAVTLASAATFSVANSAGGTGNVIFAGVVDDGGAGYSLTKTGPQQLTLAGVNTYSGDTLIGEGALAVGEFGSLAASPAVRIASGATFDVTALPTGYAVPAAQSIVGEGTVAGGMTIAATATVAPGDPVGTLTTTGDVSFGGGGNYNWQVLDATGTAGSASGWDLFDIGGALAITATSADPFAINLWSLSAADPLTSGDALNFDSTQTGTWTIASAVGGITGFAADAFTVSTAAANGTDGFANAIGTGSFSLAVSGNDLNLVFTPGGPSSDIIIDVATGSETQAQAGYPLITAADSVTKTGAGTLVMDAANTYTGPTTVSAGELQVATGSALATSPITVSAGATLSASAGTTIKAPSVTLDGGSLAAGTLLVDSATGVESLVINSGTLVDTAMTVGQGGLVILPVDTRETPGLTALAVDETSGGGLVDLGSGQFTVASGGITPADLRADIIAGRNGGAWNGTAGITSAAAASSGGTRAVGYVVAGDGTARVSFAAPGDIDLSGQVNVIDLVGIDAAGKFGSGQPADWSQGDFNYDGVVNVLDLVAIDTAGAFGSGNYFPTEPAAAGLGGSVAAVPEPGVLQILIIAAGGILAGQGYTRRRARG